MQPSKWPLHLFQLAYKYNSEHRANLLTINPQVAVLDLGPLRKKERYKKVTKMLIQYDGKENHP